jgi:hypothetical protein
MWLFGDITYVYVANIIHFHYLPCKYQAQPRTLSQFSQIITTRSRNKGYFRLLLLVMNKTEKVALKKHRAKKKKIEARKKAEKTVIKK